MCRRPDRLGELKIRVKMRNVMRLAHFGEHPDYDAKETAQIRHNSDYTALANQRPEQTTAPARPSPRFLNLHAFKLIPSFFNSSE